MQKEMTMEMMILDIDSVCALLAHVYIKCILNLISILIRPRFASHAHFVSTPFISVYYGAAASPLHCPWLM